MTGPLQRVLLLEDNQGDVDLVRLNLSESTVKFEVCCADRLSTGMSALTKETFAVILLDLYLPDSRGVATFQSVMNRTTGVPVVVLTATDDEAWAVDAVSRGAQDYIVKGDFGGGRLALTLRCAIERQALINDLNTNKKQLALKSDVRSQVEHLLVPLISIRQGVTTILDDHGSPITAAQSQHLETILLDVKQLDSLIDDLLKSTWAETY